MKTISLFTAAILVIACSTTTNSTAQSFEKGTKAINLGIGLNGSGRYYTSGFNRVGIAPTFLCALDVGVAELGPGTLGIGGVIGFNTVRSNYGRIINNGYRTTEYRSSNLILGVRANYHWNEWHSNDKLDTYAGVMAGASILISERFSDSNVGDNSTLLGSFPTYATYAGIRYLFSSNFGVYAEAGFGITFLNGGLTFKF